MLRLFPPGAASALAITLLLGLALVCCARAFASILKGSRFERQRTGQVSTGSSRMRGAFGFFRLESSNGLRLRDEATVGQHDQRRGPSTHDQDPARRAPQQPWTSPGTPRWQQSAPAPAHHQQRLFGEREEEAGRLEADGAGLRPLQGECALSFALSPPPSAIRRHAWVQCGAVQCACACAGCRMLPIALHARATAKDPAPARIPTGRVSVARVARRAFFCDPPRRSCRVAKTVHRTVSTRVRRQTCGGLYAAAATWRSRCLRV